MILLGLIFQAPGADFSTVGYKTETRKEEGKEEDMEEASEVHGDVSLQQSSELITTDTSLNKSRRSSCFSR